MEKKSKIIGWGYEIIRPLLKIFSILFLFPIINGRKNIPKKNGCILAGNHLSNYDPVVIGNVTLRPVHFLAKKELMDKKVLGKILHFMGIIRVDRQNKNPEAKSAALSALKDNKIICLFPEGTCNRKMEQELLPFKYGAVSFAYHSKKPIVPFAITRKPKLFGYFVKVIIGEPFYVATDNYEKENELLRNKVLELYREGKNEKSQRKS